MRRQNEVGGMTPALAPNVKNVYRGTAVSRRRAMTIVGAAAGLPLLGADDLSRGGPHDGRPWRVGLADPRQC